MKNTLRNIYFLSLKEYKSLFGDFIMMFLIFTVYTFVTIAIYEGSSIEVKNAVVAFVDEDKSVLSERIKQAIMEPYFKIKEGEIASKDAIKGLDSGEYTFVVDVPKDFEKDLRAGKNPKIQVMVDATATGQAGIGNGYLTDIIEGVVNDSGARAGVSGEPPIKTEVRAKYNPTLRPSARNTVTQTFLNTSILAIMLVGAAVIREKEHGTMEHLLVMPVKAGEVAFAKILSNSVVILVASVLSMKFMVQGVLKIPIEGSIPLFALSSVIFLFSASSLGMLLAILTPSMPQFGITAMLTIIVIHLICGVETPIESMPVFMQHVVQFIPDTHYIKASVDIIFKGALLEDVWKEFLYMGVIGAVYMWAALSIFKKMFEQQNT